MLLWQYQGLQLPNYQCQSIYFCWVNAKLSPPTKWIIALLLLFSNLAYLFIPSSYPLSCFPSTEFPSSVAFNEPMIIPAALYIYGWCARFIQILCWLYDIFYLLLLRINYLAFVPFCYETCRFCSLYSIVKLGVLLTLFLNIALIIFWLTHNYSSS